MGWRKTSYFVDLCIDISKTVRVTTKVTVRRRQQIPVVPVRIGDAAVFPITAVRDLGVYLDADMSMTSDRSIAYFTRYRAML